MKISNDSVVSFHFTLNVNGKTVESSFGSEPLVYLHGHNAIVPGLEEALNTHAKGDKLNITLPPAGISARDAAYMQGLALTLFNQYGK